MWGRQRNADRVPVKTEYVSEQEKPPENTQVLLSSAFFFRGMPGLNISDKIGDITA